MGSYVGVCVLFSYIVVVIRVQIIRFSKVQDSIICIPYVSTAYNPCCVRPLAECGGL